MGTLNRNSKGVLWKALANPIRKEEHYETIYERWVLGVDGIIVLDYNRHTNSLWVLFEDGDEMEVFNVARLFYREYAKLKDEQKRLIKI